MLSRVCQPTWAQYRNSGYVPGHHTRVMTAFVFQFVINPIIAGCCLYLTYKTFGQLLLT